MFQYLKIAKVLRPAYLSALAVIAVAVIMTHFVSQQRLKNRTEDARTINIAGRQRMLSQRISSKSLYLTNQLTTNQTRSTEQTCTQLLESLEIWRKSHYELHSHSLTIEDANDGGTILSRMVDLNRYVEDVKGDVETLLRIASETDGQLSSEQLSVVLKAANSIGQSTDEFLPQMNDIVYSLDDRATIYLSQYRQLQLVAAVACLLVLALTALFIFEPATRTVHRSLRDLRDSNVRAVMAAKSCAAKSEFLSNMSHEIRTPMTAILGYTDLIINDEFYVEDSNATREAMLTVRRNANHLLTIIDDILDVSKIEAGKLNLEILSTSVVDLIQDVEGLVRPRCEAKGIRFEVEYKSLLPSFVLTDPTRLRQILLNLVGNAIKFTERGQVSLAVHFNERTNLLSLSVADTGIGMTAKQREQIVKFDSFVQADQSTTRQYGGSGLGLRICNSLSQLLGGKLTVDSEYGKGSCFTVALEAKLPETAILVDGKMCVSTKADELALISKSKVLMGMHILLAEDGEDNQKLIGYLLKREGAEVTFASNGQEAIEACQNPDNTFDVVLMDMQMPIIDGYQATENLRQLGYNAPIVALTANAMSSDRKKCIEAGCSEYLSKPINRISLVETVRALNSPEVFLAEGFENEAVAVGCHD